MNLFSQQIFQRSLSLLFSRSLSLRTRQKKSFVAHHARPDDSGEEETLKDFLMMHGKNNKFLDDPAEGEEGRSV